MLPEIKIASPCPALWEQMAGNNQVRHCAQCNLNVYNFSEMTSAEIEQLIKASEGQRLCGRLYQRADGSLITRDCPVGLRTKIRRVSARLTTALAAALSLVFAAQACSQQSSHTTGVVVAIQTGFHLSVLDASGNPVDHARILLSDKNTGRKIAEGQTDNAGKFSLSRLADGDYTAIIQPPGFVSQSKFVSVKPNAMQDVDITVLLRSAVFTMGRVAMPTQLAPPVVKIK
jgi:hypothetical protein